jgi:hypothetical protein
LILSGLFAFCFLRPGVKNLLDSPGLCDGQLQVLTVVSAMPPVHPWRHGCSIFATPDPGTVPFWNNGPVRHAGPRVARHLLHDSQT